MSNPVELSKGQSKLNIQRKSITSDINHHDDDDGTTDVESRTVTTVGRVIRLATRDYHPVHSKPSSRKCTTAKVSCETLSITSQGCVGDYNHYRTVALGNTTDRAVSIVTTDCMELLRSHGYPVENGDLGENVLVDGVDYRFFQPGSVCIFSGGNESIEKEDEDNAMVAVVVEITEAMEPCANLCKLPYINDPAKTPAERIDSCRHLLSVLDQEPGLRGWYAKVLQAGVVDTATSRLYQVVNKNDF